MRKRFISIALLPLLAACNMSELPGPQEDGKISFGTTLTGYSSENINPMTRSVDVSGLGEVYLHSYELPFKDEAEVETKSAPVTTIYSSFGASGYSFPVFDDWNNTQTPTLFYNKKFTKSGTDWATDTPYKWPGGAYGVRIYAWSPYDGTTLVSAASDTGAPIIEYTCGTDIATQVDLLEGVSDADKTINGIQDYDGSGSTSQSVNLSFRHALAGVRVTTNNFGFDATLKSVTLKNINSKGRTVVYSDKWTNQSTPVTYSITPNTSIPQTGQSTAYAQEQTIFVIPQVCPADAVIDVVFTQNGVDYTLSAPLKGQEFKKGFITTYNLSLDKKEIALGITVSPLEDFTNTTTEASQEVLIKSYTIHNSGIKRDEPWVMEFSENNGASFTSVKPSWFNLSSTSGNGGITGEKITVTVPVRQATSSVAKEGLDAESAVRSEALRALPEKGSQSSPVDLSFINPDNGTALGTQNTANCYVIHEPGWYKIPLVYGNAIKNGTINVESFYTSVATGFEDSWGQKFTASSDAWIKTHASAAGKTLATADVVWNDMGCVIENVSIQGDYLVFHIPSQGITEGNMVIGVKDSDGKYAWSWHLWITGQTIQDVAITNHDGAIYNIMNVNLGWNGWIGRAKYEAYPELTCIVRIKHKNGTGYKQFKVHCLGIDGNKPLPGQTITPTAGSSPYYQWGRKDAFISTGYPTVGGNIEFSETNIAQNIAHQNPKTYYCNSNNYSWTNDAFTYYWDSNNANYNKDSPVKKTIYDPCPIGWAVPRQKTFTGFTTTGYSSNNSAEFNIIGTFDKGWKFKANSMDNIGVYFPAVGYRYYSTGYLTNISSYGYYWLSVPGDLNYGCYLDFGSSNVGPLSNSRRSYGYAVRPARPE